MALVLLAPARPAGPVSLLLLGQVLGFPLVAGGEGGLAVVDQASEFLDEHGDGCTAAVEAVGHRPPGVAPVLQGRITGQQPCPFEAAR